MSCYEPAAADQEFRLERARKDDLPSVLRLLASAGLPLAGVPDHFDNFLVVRHVDRVVGCVGFELHAPDAVLRSLAVDPACRRRGLGRQLTDHVILLARTRGARTGYVLTTTVEAFLGNLGFQRCNRSEVPEAVARSVEFAGSCCSTAVCMRRALDSPSCCSGR